MVKRSAIKVEQAEVEIKLGEIAKTSHVAVPLFSRYQINFDPLT